MSEPLHPKGGSLHRGLLGGRTVRILTVEARLLCDEVRERHALDRNATQIAGELLLANLLMGAWIKGEERITLQVHGEQPAFAFTGDVDALGGARARLAPPVLGAEAARLSGYLLAIKSDARRELYRSLTPVSGASVEEALRAHLGDSAQVGALLRLGVRLGEDGRVAFAGGVMIERLPEDPKLPSISAAQFAETYGPLQDAPVEDILVGVAFGKLLGIAIEPLEDRQLVWRCACSKARVLDMLYSLGPVELGVMLEEDGHAEVRCHFCNTAELVLRDELVALLERHAAGRQA